MGARVGFGSTTIQLARAFGANVIATARTTEKCSSCLALGAQHALNYAETDFPDEVMKLTSALGVDVIFDWIGEKYFEKHIGILKRKGRLVLIDSWGRDLAKLDLGRVIVKNLYVMGSVLRGRPPSRKGRNRKRRPRYTHPDANFSSDSALDSLYDSVLSRTQEAHAIMEESSHIGKIILTPEEITTPHDDT